MKLLRRWLPARPEDSHKGDFGHVLVVAGSRGMTGAAVLAARGALRAGCGLVTVALPESQQPVAAAHLVEAMTLPLPETPAGGLCAIAVGKLQAFHESRGCTVLAVGPGLGAGAETETAIVGMLGSLPMPAVIDADALNALALQPRAAVKTLLERRKAPAVFTPHPGELARMLRMRTEAVLSDREAAARLLARELGGICLLKGRPTIVTDGTRVWLNPTGNPGLAKGGTGDALTGIIAGLWAQRIRAAGSGTAPAAPGGPRGAARIAPGTAGRGTAPADDGFEAAALGAFLHGFAADSAVREKTSRALLASDVIEALPAALRVLGG